MQDLKKIDDKELEKLVNFIPKDKKQEALRIIQQRLTITTIHSGPLPAPEQLKEYNEIIENGANRIMTLTEKQLAHRINSERKIINSEIIKIHFAQVVATLITLVLAYFSFQLGMSGHTEAAIGLGTTTIIGVVSIFIYGKRKQEK